MKLLVNGKHTCSKISVSSTKGCINDSIRTTTPRNSHHSIFNLATFGTPLQSRTFSSFSRRTSCPYRLRYNSCSSLRPFILFPSAEEAPHRETDVKERGKRKETVMAGFNVPRFTTLPSLSGAESGKCPAVRWRDVGESGVRSSIVPLLAKNFPLLMTGYWTHQILQKDALPRWKNFEGIKSVFQGYGLNQLRVDVSCTKKGGTFRGDQASRQHVSLRLMDMVELAEACKMRKPHWATAEDVGLDYYLCQCPVLSREPGKPEVLGAISREFRTPSFVRDEDLLQVNLWLGAMETKTNMHFDANHNLLFVLKGTKHVVLVPPSMPSAVEAMPVFSESPNHSAIEPEHARKILANPEALHKGAVYTRVAEGEAIFIPEGWWHQVSSARGTVGVNVWFKGLRPALCEHSSRHMRTYYLRCLCESLLSDRLRDAAFGEEAAETGGKRRLIGSKRPLSGRLRQEPSPLCDPESTPEQRNLYLRNMGTDRMQEELPRIAREHPTYWARLVTDLDPRTAHAVTAQWEAAGGPTSMPDFYRAIFGEDSPPTGAEDGAAGAVSVLSPTRKEQGKNGDSEVEGGGIEEAVQAGGTRSNEFCGIALQERLARLKETFAREEFAKLMREATE